MAAPSRKRYMAFSGAELDHSDHERTDDAVRAAAAEPEARALLFHGLNAGLSPDGRPLSAPVADLGERELADPGLVFLGRSERDRRAWFAAELPDPTGLATVDAFPDMRFSAGAMEPEALAIAGRARALLDWHATHRFCANCGVRSAPAKGGAVRMCGACGREHYPRVNPVAIMLVTHSDGGEDSVLLGRQANWPPGSFSTLAGFVSPGEDLEECCAREVHEEVGVRVSDVRYLMSQSWPFPSQLMLGLAARAQSRELTVDESELETARWFTRTEVEAVFAKVGDAFRRPPRFTIAHQLLRHWLQEGPEL